MLKSLVVASLLFIPAYSIAGDCLKDGQTSSISGVPGPNGWQLKDKCCKGLVDVEALSVCDKGQGGGYVYVCTNCGNGTCETHESACNCPKDCNKSSK